MFALCEGMKWTHLPVAGGIYDQHPKLMDEWRIIFGIRSEKQAKEAEAEKRKANANRPRGGGPRVAGGMR